MAPPEMYHEGSRRLQDRFDHRRVADQLERVLVHTNFAPEDRAFINRCSMFFLATADAEGRPDCSYKGGMRGFVGVLDEHTLAFPDYNGNGMFKSLGNILVNPNVGLLFIDFEDPHRLRMNGIASIQENDPLLSEYPGAQLIIRVRATRIFPNCPRYIHRMRMVKESIYLPRADRRPPIPAWKRWDEFRPHLPKSDGKLKPNLSTYLRRLEQRGNFYRLCVEGLRRVRHFLLR